MRRSASFAEPEIDPLGPIGNVVVGARVGKR